MAVIALIPARAGSKSVPGKNLRTLGGKTLIQHAVACAQASGVADVVMVSTDIDLPATAFGGADVLRRPAELATDTTPMLDVVRHAIKDFSGIDTVLLLQPTQPLRRPEHVQQAITLLQESGAESVVSLIAVPTTHHPVFQFQIRDGRAHRGWSYSHEIGSMPACRQAVETTYIRDGTVYAFRRQTVARYGTLYGRDVMPLVIDPADSCELDTEQDWAEVERRWKERHGG